MSTGLMVPDYQMSTGLMVPDYQTSTGLDGAGPSEVYWP